MKSMANNNECQLCNGSGLLPPRLSNLALSVKGSATPTVDVTCPHCEGSGVDPVNFLTRLRDFIKSLFRALLPIVVDRSGNWRFSREALTGVAIFILGILASFDLIAPVPEETTGEFIYKLWDLISMLIAIYGVKVTAKRQREEMDKGVK